VISRGKKPISVFDLGKPFEETISKYSCRKCGVQMCLGSCEVLPNSTDNAWLVRIECHACGKVYGIAAVGYRRDR